MAGKSFRRAVSTTRELTLAGSTDASTPVNRVDRNGSPSTRSSAVAAIATGHGRRIRACASRYQPPCSPDAVRSTARRQRGSAPAFTRGPSRTKSAGQHGERDQPGERPDEAAGDAHRLEKPEREDRHRRDRGARP